MRHDRLIRQHIRTRYVVTLTNDETFEGVLVDADDSHLVLADTTSIAGNGDRLAVDGHLWLPRAGIAYMQVTTR